MNNHESNFYRLKLNNDVCWRLNTGSVALQPWVRKLAGIMELDVSHGRVGDREISFMTGHKGGLHPFIGESSAKGLKCHDMEAVCIRHHHDTPDVICTVKPFSNPEMEITAMWNALYPIYLETIESGGLPFHGGLLELDGRGVLMAGRSGTGKSTCCDRLPHHWNPLCDDETLVVVDHEGNYTAHPFPTWSRYLGKGVEKTWHVQRFVPICGVFFMEQSDADETIFMGDGKAAVCLSQSSAQLCRKYWRRADVAYQRAFRENLFDNACKMAKRIPAFRLRVSLHGRFWEEIERVLGW